MADPGRRQRKRALARGQRLQGRSATFTATELAHLGPDVRLRPRAHRAQVVSAPTAADALTALVPGLVRRRGNSERPSGEPELGRQGRAVPAGTERGDRGGVRRDSALLSATRTARASSSTSTASCRPGCCAPGEWPIWPTPRRLPDIVFSLPEELQWAFLEGYFLGDGTTAGAEHLLSPPTRPTLRKDCCTCWGSLGLVAATVSALQPSTSAGRADPDAPALSTF